MIYYINAYTTLVSAALGVCFSIGAVIKGKGNNRTNALYMFVRSLALTSTRIKRAVLSISLSAENEEEWIMICNL